MALLEPFACFAPSDLSFDFPPFRTEDPSKTPFDFLFGANTENNVMVNRTLIFTMYITHA